MKNLTPVAVLLAVLAVLLISGKIATDGIISSGAGVQGVQGVQGTQGAKGDTGATGAKDIDITGSCTLNGMMLATCTADVSAASVTLCVCTYQSSTLPHVVSCAPSAGILTAVSATSLDNGVVAFVCF